MNFFLLQPAHFYLTICDLSHENMSQPLYGHTYTLYAYTYVGMCTGDALM